MSPALVYGSLIGLGQLLASLIVFAMGLHSDPARIANGLQTESLIGFIALMIVVSLSYRAAKARGETETIGSAAKIAALAAVVGAFFTGLGQYLYLALINPRLSDIQRSLTIQGQKAYLDGLSPEKLAEEMKRVDFMVSPLARAISYAMPTFVFATLLGIAFALIFRAAIRRDAALVNPPKKKKAK